MPMLLMQVEPALFAGCTKIFLDVGSNRGTHIRKLFEAQKYPESKYLKMFDEAFGPKEMRSKPFAQTGICAFGFEANPIWTSTLHRIEQAYRAQGWRVKMFTEQAVGNSTGTLVMWDNNHLANSDWGFSSVKTVPDATEVDVPRIDFSTFIEIMHKNAPSGHRLMKMDIEGAEFSVLPRFLDKQLLCKNVVDTMTIEWHDRFFEGDKAHQAQRKRLESQVESSTKCSSGPSTSVKMIDDESYLNDGMPLP